MEKNLVEFRRIEGEGDGRSYLHVMAVAMKEDEQREVRKELDRYGFNYIVIEADVVIAKLYEGPTLDGTDTLTADDLVEIAGKLEEDGWKW